MIFNIMGNPVDGFSLHGPFNDFEDAVEWQERWDESSWIIESNLPDHSDLYKILSEEQRNHG